MSKSKFRKIKISDVKYIGPLQMDGPILTPIMVSEVVALDIVRRSYKVREVNDDGKEIVLTTKNFHDENRFGQIPSAKPVVVHIPSPKVETPLMTDKKELVIEDPIEPVIEDESNGKRVELDTAIPVPESGPILTDSAGNIIPGAVPSMITIPTSSSESSESDEEESSDESEDFEDVEDAGEESTDSSSESQASNTNSSKNKSKRRRKKR